MRPQKSLRDELRFVAEFAALLDVIQHVAVSKLRRIEDLAAKQPALSSIVARDFFPLLPKSAQGHPLVRGRGVGRQLLVVLTSDEGMVGPLHAAVIRHALTKADASTQWILVGQRGVRFLRDQTIARRVLPSPMDEEVDRAMRSLSREIIAQYTRHALQAAWLVAPRFLSATRQDVVIWPLLPLPVQGAAMYANEQEMVVEPSLERAIEQLAACWVEQVCVEACWSARRAEYAARALHVEVSRQELAKRARLVRYWLFKAMHERVDVLVRETSVVQRVSARRQAAQAVR
jgi:F-type H+-transporting ATPase subunit gamma